MTAPACLARDIVLAMVGHRPVQTSTTILWQYSRRKVSQRKPPHANKRQQRANGLGAGIELGMAVVSSVTGQVRGLVEII